MGVGYFSCGACGVSVCDCGDYGECEQCGGRFCTYCFGEYDPDDFGPDDDAEAVAAMKAACPICSGEVITDEMLVKFLLKQLKWSRKRAEKEFRK